MSRAELRYSATRSRYMWYSLLHKYYFFIDRTLQAFITKFLDALQAHTNETFLLVSITEADPLHTLQNDRRYITSQCPPCICYLLLDSRHAVMTDDKCGTASVSNFLQLKNMEMHFAFVSSSSHLLLQSLHFSRGPSSEPARRYLNIEDQLFLFFWAKKAHSVKT